LGLLHTYGAFGTVLWGALLLLRPELLRQRLEPRE
jgi:hypothetical protein